MRIFQAAWYKPSIIFIHTFEGENVNDGFYRIRYKGIVQLAFYTNEEVENLDTGTQTLGFWRFVEGVEIDNNDEIGVLGGPYDAFGNSLTSIIFNTDPVFTDGIFSSGEKTEHI